MLWFPTVKVKGVGCNIPLLESFGWDVLRLLKIFVGLIGSVEVFEGQVQETILRSRNSPVGDRLRGWHRRDSRGRHLFPIEHTHFFLSPVLHLELVTYSLVFPASCRVPRLYALTDVWTKTQNRCTVIVDETVLIEITPFLHDIESDHRQLPLSSVYPNFMQTVST